MKVLVTGAAGFIGSHVCERLLKDPNTEVLGIDNFDGFYPKKLKELNLETLNGNPGFRFLQTDLRERESLFEALNEQKVDAVIHLAAKAGVQPSIEDVNGYIDANIVGTQHLLDWMLEMGVKKLVFGSSSSVYGNRSEVPFSEDAKLGEPISPYAFTKASNELMTYTYHHLHGMDVVNLRFFTVIGPRQRPDLAVHKFFRLIHQGKPITMYGKGDTARDYTYVGDIVGGVTGALNYVNANKGVYEIINLGNHTPVNLRDMIDTIIQISEKEVRVVMEGEKRGDVHITYANISKARKLLGYQPQTTFEEGVRKFYDWFKAHRDILV